MARRTIIAPIPFSPYLTREALVRVPPRVPANMEQRKGEDMAKERKTLRPLIIGDYYTDGWTLVEVEYITSKGDVDFRDCRSEEVTRVTIQNFRTIFRRVKAEEAA